MQIDTTALATKEELASKADKSEIPSVDGLASETYVDEKIDVVNNKFDGITIKRITQVQYDALSTKDSNTLYIIVSE